MKKINFAFISDLFFIVFCVFLISFTAIRHHTGRATFSLILSVALSLAAAAPVFMRLYSKRAKKLACALDEREKKSLALHLSVCGRAAIINLFCRALEATPLQDNCLTGGQCAYYFNFKMAPISADDVAEIIRKESPLKKCVLCSRVAPDALSLANDFEIEVKDIGDIYVILKDKGLLPTEYALGKIKKPPFFSAVKARFNRKLCAPLFFSGVTLLLFSFFTFFPVYYIASGAALTALSALSLLFGQSS